MGISKQQLVNTVEQIKTYTDANDANLSKELDSVKNAINRIPKHSYEGLEYCMRYSRISEKNVPTGDNFLIHLDAIESNMENRNDGYIKLTKGKVYSVRAGLLTKSFCTYVIKDLNGKEYGSVGCSYTGNNPLFSDVHAVATIKPEEDIYIGVVNTVQNTVVIYSDRSWFTIEEIATNNVMIDPLNYVNEDVGIEDNPVGQIIPFMGTTAPKHYVICDGTVYPISTYPLLAEHFKTHFGSVKYFGGNGTTTFAVPDLRNEFIRGYHGEATDQLSGEIGKHQDATRTPAVRIYPKANPYTGIVQIGGNARSEFTDNIDTDTLELGVNYVNLLPNDAGAIQDPSLHQYITSRPTNVAVLYCIKYEPTYYMNIASYGYEVDTLLDGFHHTANSAVTLDGNIEQYDFIQVWGINAVRGANKTGVYSDSMIIPRQEYFKLIDNVGDIPYTFMMNSSTIGTSRTISFGFADGKTLKIGVVDGNSGITKIYGLRRKNQVEKTDNRETQSVIIEGLTSTSAANTYFEYPKGYNNNNSIIRSFNILAGSGWVIPHQLSNYIQLQTDRICVNIGTTSWYGRKVQFELAKKSSVVEQSRYSTDEIPIGTWIDDKTIYRKFIDVTNSVNTTDAKLSLSSLGITGVDTVCEIKGWLTRSDIDYKVPIPWACYGDTSWNMGISANSSEIRLEIGSSYLAKKAKIEVLIEYTKLDK